MQILTIHPDNPQPRFVEQAAEVFRKGGLVIYPTRAGYSIGCDAENKKAIDRLYAVKKPIKKPLMALLFQNFSDITKYAQVDNAAFRLMREKMPGPYTFILPAQIHIARKLDVKRHEIGVRMPTHPFLIELHHHFQNPILNTAARLDEDGHYTRADELEKAFRGKVDLLIDCGEIQINPTTVVSLLNGAPEVLRGEL
jgi:tRNA threonylcarbamoyl adenosine modification protein (Sua5/YciO/YrdC/YwlC family)